MNRTPSTLKKTVAAALASVALWAPTAHATIIDFEDADPGFLGNGDTVQSRGFSFTSFSNDSAADLGALSGAIFDGTDTGFCTTPLACPVNNASRYFAGLDDGSAIMKSATSSHFKLSGFDASFIGGGGAYPAMAGLLQVYGITAQNTVHLLEYALGGPGAGGFLMNHRNTGAAFSALELTEVYFYGYMCDASQNCHDTNTLKAQFALDNVDVTDVPEPATAALMLLGLAGLAATRRRAAQA
ncbi:NF038120 family PEP-CTERM protein [Pseudoduganella namucuonensis]|uniref:PEP-CTERM protein-sorting domain-containing protein/MYXO-CTERM domain-containing protein n=1 Tax=Pseudoduganella namucuonensis TaxID=1035707 RepID=A0A1I7LY22_9BURK|nr:NF038120 family PEP-CTERM protein [Pseudoduganella namucuonensis]SFV14614.1 PEP-CTERM protein-sorting domain-containing protein/MYXO-CTERM domain-containing protein [Pseudoduganella namucuonensis]